MVRNEDYDVDVMWAKQIHTKNKQKTASQHTREMRKWAEVALGRIIGHLFSKARRPVLFADSNLEDLPGRCPPPKYIGTLRPQRPCNAGALSDQFSCSKYNQLKISSNIRGIKFKDYLFFVILVLIEKGCAIERRVLRSQQITSLVICIARVRNMNPWVVFGFIR